MRWLNYLPTKLPFYLAAPFFFLRPEEEKALQKARREREAREARVLRIERDFRLTEQRTLAEQGQVLREVDLLVHKPAEASLGASFIDVSTMDWSTRQDHITEVQHVCFPGPSKWRSMNP